MLQEATASDWQKGLANKTHRAVGRISKNSPVARNRTATVRIFDKSNTIATNSTIQDKFFTTFVALIAPPAGQQLANQHF